MLIPAYLRGVPPIETRGVSRVFFRLQCKTCRCFLKTRFLKILCCPQSTASMTLLKCVAPITVTREGLDLRADHRKRWLGWPSNPWKTPQNKQYLQAWKESIRDLKQAAIPRFYAAVPLRSTQQREIFIFSYTPTVAIAAVAYPRVTDSSGKYHWFLDGESQSCTVSSYNWNYVLRSSMWKWQN